MENEQLTTYPAACTPAMQCLHVYDSGMYNEAYQCLSQVMFTPALGITVSFHRCTAEGKQYINQIAQDVQLFFEEGRWRAIESYGNAIRDMICFAYLEKQEPARIRLVEFEESSSRNLVDIWQTIVRKSVTNTSVGQKYATYFETHSPASQFNRLLRESIAIEAIVLNGGNTREGLLALARARDQLSTGSGHYMIVLTDDHDPQWFRQYVGQATNVSDRLRKHEGRQRYYKEKPPNTLNPLYLHWLKDEKRAHYVPLHHHSSAFGETQEEKNTWLCLVEMFYCLVFQTLQPSYLDQWLGQEGRAVSRGLNVQLPLYQGETFRGPEGGFGSLFSSEDPEVRQQGHDHMDRIRPLAEAARKASGYKTNAAGTFKAKGAARHRVAQEGDPVPVKIRCGTCKSEKSVRIDDSPKFCVTTGKYVVRQLRCEGECELSKSEVGKRKVPIRYHFPIDRAEDKWVRGNEAAKKAGRAAKAAQKAPQLPTTVESVEEQAPPCKEEETSDADVKDEAGEEDAPALPPKAYYPPST